MTDSQTRNIKNFSSPTWGLTDVSVIINMEKITDSVKKSNSGDFLRGNEYEPCMCMLSRYIT